MEASHSTPRHVLTMEKAMPFSNMNKSKLLLIIGILLLTAGVVVFAVAEKQGTKIADTNNTNDTQGVICTMDAKLCPDGSYVGRTGPACEFSQCPGSVSEPQAQTVTLGIGETIEMFGVSARLVEVLEDSRCPANANCIWAGTVRVKAHAVYGVLQQDVVLELNKPFELGGHSATLVDVKPQKVMNQEYVAADYQFTFDIK